MASGLLVTSQYQFPVGHEQTQSETNKFNCSQILFSDIFQLLLRHLFLFRYLSLFFPIIFFAYFPQLTRTPFLPVTSPLLRALTPAPTINLPTISSFLSTTSPSHLSSLPLSHSPAPPFCTPQIVACRLTSHRRYLFVFATRFSSNKMTNIFFVGQFVASSSAKMINPGAYNRELISRTIKTIKQTYMSQSINISEQYAQFIRRNKRQLTSKHVICASL